MSFFEDGIEAECATGDQATVNPTIVIKPTMMPTRRETNWRGPGLLLRVTGRSTGRGESCQDRQSSVEFGEATSPHRRSQGGL